MPRKKPAQPSDPWIVDANQVVAYNFSRIREEKNWTQDETSARLAPFIGQTLTKNSISAIETSYKSDRRRVFTAQEIVAFALAFDVPVLWFFIPPGDGGYKLAGAKEPLTELWRIVIGTADQADRIGDRLKELGLENEDAAKALSAGRTGSRQLPWKHFREFQLRQLLGVVDDDYDKLVKLYADMGELVDRFETAKTKQVLAADAPRKAYKYAAEIFHGKALFGALSNARHSRRSDFLVTDAIHNQTEVPWEEIIDPDNPAIRDALIQLAEAIDPKLSQYFDHYPPRS